MASSTIVQQVTAGSVFTFTTQQVVEEGGADHVDKNFTGVTSVALMSQNQDSLGAISFNMDVVSGHGTFSLSTEQKRSLFSSDGSSNQGSTSDTVSVSVDKANGDSMYALSTLDITTYLAPAPPSVTAVNSGVRQSTITFTDVPRTSFAGDTEEEITKATVYLTKGFLASEAATNPAAASLGLLQIPVTLGSNTDKSGITVGQLADGTNSSGIVNVAFASAGNNTYTLIITGLVDFYLYEAAFKTGSNVGYSTMSATSELAPNNTLAAPGLTCQTITTNNTGTLTSAATDTVTATNPTLASTNAQLTIVWNDTDGLVMVKTVATGDTNANTNSNAQLQIFKANADGSYPATGTPTYTQTLTNAQCIAAADLDDTCTLYQTVPAGVYKARVKSLNTVDVPLEEYGDWTSPINVYVQTALTFNDLVVTVDQASGSQSFSVTYDVPATNDAGAATPTAADSTTPGSTDGGNTGRVDLAIANTPTGGALAGLALNNSGDNITTDGSLNTSDDALTYAQCKIGNVQATFTVQDANNAGIIYTYPGTIFVTYAIKTPTSATADFVQNQTAVTDGFTSTLTAFGADPANSTTLVGTAYGYTITNVSYQVSGHNVVPSAATHISSGSGSYDLPADSNLQDISGIYPLTNDPIIPVTVEILDDAFTTTANTYRIKVIQKKICSHILPTTHLLVVYSTQCIQLWFSSAGIFKTNPTIDSLVLTAGKPLTALAIEVVQSVTVTLNETTLETTGCSYTHDDDKYCSRLVM